MPENWKTYKFSELFETASGLSKSRDQFGFGSPFLTFKDVFYNYFIPSELGDLANTTEKEQIRGSVKRGDIFLTRTSETLHELGMSSVALKDYPNATFNGFCKRLRQKNGSTVKIHPEFIGYFLRSNSFRNEVSSHATMTTRASLNNTSISSLSITLPPFAEQVEIGQILKALDAKIELNLQMNKTLEEMAMALYKHWFVDFGPFQDGEFVDSELGEIPKGWEVKRLDEISFVKGGKRLPKGAQLQTNPNSHPYLRVKDFNSTYLNVSGMEYVPDDVFSSISNYIVNTGDITLSIVGTIGKVALIGEDLNLASLTENCVKITSKTETIFSEIIYLQLTSKNGQDEIQSKTVGSTQPKLPIYNINSLNLAFPTDFTVVKKVTIELQNWFKIIYSNTIENQTLTQLRDTLLPKLISGEVSVKVAEKTLSEVL